MINLALAKIIRYSFPAITIYYIKRSRVLTSAAARLSPQTCFRLLALYKLFLIDKITLKATSYPTKLLIRAFQEYK